MPSLPNSDDFPYYGQAEDLPECVPACVAMVFEYLGVDCSWNALKDQLRFDPHGGTPFDNIADLEGVRVTRVGDLQEAEQHLSAPSPTPVIADLLILDDEVLGYFLDSGFVLHAVVVVAVDEFEVTFSDPLSHHARSTESHRVCARGVFELSWQRGFALRRLTVGGGDAAR